MFRTLPLAGSRSDRRVNPVVLAGELVRINSATGEEGLVGEYLAGRLEELGYEVTRQEVSPGRFNVYAVREPPTLVFTTHMDTVPPTQEFREDETWLYGRGTVDAKGIAAVQIAAAEQLCATGERRVALLFVVGEETCSDGAQAAAVLEPKGRYIINGEPTENCLALGTKGSVRVELVAHGLAAHSAYPGEGNSAIETMLDAIERVRRLRFPPDPMLGEVTLNVGTISGGVRSNVIPDVCRAELMFRTVSDNREIVVETKRAAGESVRVRVVLEMPPVRLESRPGFETTVVRFSTDLPFLASWGRRFLLGPGSIRVAHTDRERVAKHDLLEGVRLYERLASELLAEDTR